MITQADIVKWLTDWFQKRNPGAEICSTDNYYVKGLIDSFGIVELIAEIEDSFDIYFSDEDLRSAEFRTIQGLSKTINKHKGINGSGTFNNPS